MARKTRVVTAFEAWEAVQTGETTKDRKLAQKVIQRFFIIASKAERDSFKTMVAEAEARAAAKKA